MKRQLTITAELVASALRSNNQIPSSVVTEGLPDDALLCGTALNERGDLVLTFHSIDFKDELPIDIEITKVAVK